MARDGHTIVFWCKSLLSANLLSSWFNVLVPQEIMSLPVSLFTDTTYCVEWQTNNHMFQVLCEKFITLVIGCCTVRRINCQFWPWQTAFYGHKKIFFFSTVEMCSWLHVTIFILQFVHIRVCVLFNYLLKHLILPKPEKRT